MNPFCTLLSLSDYNRAKQQQAHAPPPANYVSQQPLSSKLVSNSRDSIDSTSDTTPLKPLQPAPSAPDRLSTSQPATVVPSQAHPSNENQRLSNAASAPRPSAAFAEPPESRMRTALEDDTTDTPPASGHSSPKRSSTYDSFKPIRSPSPVRNAKSGTSQLGPVWSAVKQALALEPDRHADEHAAKRPSVGRSISAPPAHQQFPIIQQPLPQTVPQHLIKTSFTHPLHISPLLPPASLANSYSYIFPQSEQVNEASSTPRLWFLKQEVHRTMPQVDNNGKASLGNFLLSSCPGKKVRLTLPFPPSQSNRSAISRDVFVDLQRASTEYNARAIICCLDDAELAMLGAPWPEYSEAAEKLQIKVFRLPLQEGYAPESLEVVDDLLSSVIKDYTIKGYNVLCHCRGGVGRAGLLGVAWWLKMGFAGDLTRASPDHVVESSVRWIRQRRRSVILTTGGLQLAPETDGESGLQHESY